MNIKDIVKDNKVRFLRYRKGTMYYAVLVPSEGIDYMFPVPLEDVRDATLEAEDKATLFMRYIRIALEDGSFVKAV
jgi:hypothetical protein